MATNYNPSIITNGLVFCLDAANTKSYPGSNTVWTDLAIRAACTLTNGPTYSANNQGYISFDGTDDYVVLPNNSFSTLTNTTFSVWFYLNSGANWQRIYDFGRGQGLNVFFTPTSNSGVPRFVINIGGGEQQLNDTTGASTGVWYNFVVTLNGSIGQMYRNNVLVASSSSFTYTPASLGSTTQTWFGRSQYPDPYLNGSIAQFSAYSRVLSAEEISQNYNALRGRFGL